MAIDYEVIFAPGYDPCAVLAQLKPAYMKLMLEGGTGAATRIKFRDRDVEFAKQDLSGWEKVMNQLALECGKVTGVSARGAAVGRARVCNPCQSWRGWSR